MKRLLLTLLLVGVPAMALKLSSPPDGTGMSQSTADTLYLKKGNDTATGLSSHTFQTIQVNTGILGSGVMSIDNAANFGTAPDKSTFTVAGLLQMVAGSTITTNNGTLSFSTAASAALTTQTPIFITANGRVGIGGNRFNVAPTGSPTQPDANVLMLFGKGTDDGVMEAMMFTGQGVGGPTGSGAFTTSEKIILTNYASSKGAIFSPNDGAIGLIGTGDAAAFVGFFTNNTTANPAERMRVHSDGNVGISTDTPTSTLHVAGSAAFGSGLTQSSFTAAGFLNMSAAAAIALGSRTKAQLEAATSTAGQIYYCSDCSNSVRVVVGTTTLSGWDSLIGGTAWH